MQNIDIRFNATSNFAAVEAQMAGLQAQAKSLSATFAAQGLAAPGTLDPGRWRAATNAVEKASSAYRNAASSSGLLNTQQIRANSEVKRYTDLLRKQKLGIRDMTRNFNVMKEAYRDQLRMQRMTAQHWGTDSRGRQVVDITTPKNVPADLNTMRNQIGFVGQALKSASTQMINFGKNTQWAGRQLMVGFTMPVAIFGALAGTLAYQVDQQMTRITKVYDASTDSMIDKERELNNLRTDSMRVARDAAKAYGVAAKDTLSVEAELAATGLQGKELTGTTKETVRIATLGELDFDKSIAATVAIQSAFRKTVKDGDDLTATFDYMNALENATSLSLKDMTEAIPRAAAGFAQLGGTVKELGVLMVAMKESGVDPATGANALKSAATRIISPVTKAKEFYEKYNIDLEQMAKQSGGNLFDYLKLLGEQQQKIQGPTEKQTNLLRAQGVAALFGTYQNNRLTAALVNLSDAYGGVQNQAYRALEVTKLSRRELAAIAEGELAQKMSSASGQFQSKLESIKIELAEMGKPFLQAATGILSVLEKLVEGFNSLPDGVKKFMMWGAIITAIVGPLIMLTGLFFNLAGHVGKVIAFFMTLGTRFKFLTESEQMANVTTKELTSSLTTQTGAVNTLSAELKVLAESYAIATKAATQHFNASSAGVAAAGAANAGRIAGVRSPLGTPVPVVGAGGGAAPVPGMLAVPGRASVGSMLGVPYAGPVQKTPTTMAGITARYDKNGRQYFRTPEGKQASASQIAGYKKLAALQTKIQGSETQTAAARQASAAAAERTAREAGKTDKALMKGAKSAGLMQIALVGSMFTSGKLSDVLTKTFMGAMAFSAVAQMGLFTQIGASWKRGTAGLTKLKGVGGKAFAGLTKGAKAFGRAMLGPIGLATAAIAGGLYLAWKKMKEPQEQQEAINRSVQTWADTLGVVEKKYAAIDMSINQYDDQTVSTQEIADKLVSTDDGKKMVEALKAANESGDEGEVDMMAAQEYIKLLSQTNATAQDAQRAIEAMYLAAGMGFIEAGTRAADLGDALGETVDGSDLNMLWSAQLDEALTSFDGTIDERATGIAEMLHKSLLGASSRSQQNQLILNFATTFDNMSKEVWAREVGDELKPALEPFAPGTNPAEVLKMFNDMAADAVDPGNTMSENETALKLVAQNVASQFGVTTDELANLRLAYDDLSVGQKNRITELGIAEDKIVDKVKEELGIKSEVHSMNDILKTDEWKIYTTTAKNVKARVQGIKEELRLARRNVPIGPLAHDESYALEQINLRLRKVGLEEIESLDDKINWQLLHQKENQQKINNEIDSGKAKLQAALKVWREFRNGGWAEAQKDALANTAGAAADAMSATFEAGQQAEMDKLDNKFENQSSALENRQEAASNALDKRTEARENALDARGDRIAKHFDNLTEKTNAFFDNRIEGINKSIEAEEKADAIRQRLFDREITRISRLAEAQNRNVDFNMAINQGQFDEAAKIQNDAVASTETNAFEDAGEKADQQSEARRDRLQKQIDRLEKRRDAKMKAIDNAREAAEKALEIDRERAQKSAEIERNHLEKIHEMQTNALQKRQEQERAAVEKSQELEAARFDKQLELLRNYIPTSEKDLKKHMQRLAKNYDEFGEAYADTAIGWGSFITKEMNSQMRLAAINLKSEVNWAGAGHDAGTGMVAGMAKAMGMSTGEFRKWLGVEAPGARPKPPSGSGGGKDKPRRDQHGVTVSGPDNPGANVSNHRGGLIGRGGSGRTGYSGSQHRNERWVNATDREYMMSEDAVNRIGVDKLDAMNNGRMGLDHHGRADGGDIGGAGTTAGNFMMGMAATLMAKSLMTAIASKTQHHVDAKAAKEARQAAASGKYAAGKAGMYSDRFFSKGQLKNAATIASVGKKMGLSARDIEIGIMTAITESGLVNVNYGDLDSLGLFQQRSSWGSAANRTNPEWAAHKFFSVLKGVGDRAGMSPWMAAQSVQRSAFSDGSNYRQYWDNAQAIFNGLSVQKGASGDLVQGAGGRHRPAIGPLSQGLHDQWTGYPAVDIDIPNGVHPPIWAAADGKVTRSYDIGSPPGYSSYGRVIYIDHGGFTTLYAHLNSRIAQAGQHVRGGTVIGRGGTTGNSTGDHLHFGVNASSGVSPYAFLKKGGTIRHDNTPALLHQDERVLSAPLTKELDRGLKNLSNGATHITIDMRGAYIKEDVDIEKAVYKAIDKRDDKKGRRRVVR